MKFESIVRVGKKSKDASVKGIEVASIRATKPKSVESQITCGALFSGIGGFCTGFEEIGFRTAWAVDLAPEAIKTYESNFPSTPVFRKDITQVTANDLAPVDVLHAGFPCQSFSGAGDKLGFEDPRGKLFFDVIRLVNEWGKHRPKVIVLENSPYLMIGDEGRWFDVVRSKIQNAGY